MSRPGTQITGDGQKIMLRPATAREAKPRACPLNVRDWLCVPRETGGRAVALTRSGDSKLYRQAGSDEV